MRDWTWRVHHPAYRVALGPSGVTVDLEPSETDGPARLARIRYDVRSQRVWTEVAGDAHAGIALAGTRLRATELMQDALPAEALAPGYRPDRDRALGGRLARVIVGVLGRERAGGGPVTLAARIQPRRWRASLGDDPAATVTVEGGVVAVGRYEIADGVAVFAGGTARATGADGQPLLLADDPLTGACLGLDGWSFGPDGALLSRSVRVIGAAADPDDPRSRVRLAALLQLCDTVASALGRAAARQAGPGAAAGTVCETVGARPLP